jgi:hypothetical protein
MPNHLRVSLGYVVVDTGVAMESAPEAYQLAQ